MFTKKITESDAFLDMPASTQCLYFHMNLNADDDGFLNNPRKIQRIIGASDDDFKLLIAKQFILSFENGIIVIKHWKMHNYIQADRYKPSDFEKEKSMLVMKKGKAYSLVENTECIQDGYSLDTNCVHDVSVGKDRLGKDRLDKVREKIIVDNKVVKRKFGEYKHVLLTDDELEKLKKDFSDYENMIKNLDEYIEMKGAKYKNHYLTMRKWARKDGTGGRKEARNTGRTDEATRELYHSFIDDLPPVEFDGF